MSIEIVEGKYAVIHFDASRCVHSRNCVLAHPDVFVPNVEGAWIHPDAQPLEELVRIAQNCPSGAIRVTAVGAAAPVSDRPPIVNLVRVRENGPLAVEAEMTIKGEAAEVPRATLCRCGLSKNKPYCDGSHVAAVFSATGEPASVEFSVLERRAGVLAIDPLKNGPLQVRGNLEVVSGTGRTVNKVTSTYLCRCGLSKNKPYCDGSHVAAGFLAD
jgi:CDGSH-type Zn-finger protein/uncharacterized Fe-S cluster protein YjdI